MYGIQISRSVLVPNKGWERISLEEDEAMEVIARVRLINTSLMKICMEDAEKIGKFSPTNQVRIGLALFDKLGLHSFTAYREELACKADLIRDAARKEAQSFEQTETQS